jgi:hypothetical protein
MTELGPLRTPAGSSTNRAASPASRCISVGDAGNGQHGAHSTCRRGGEGVRTDVAVEEPGAGIVRFEADRDGVVACKSFDR